MIKKYLSSLILFLTLSVIPLSGDIFKDVEDGIKDQIGFYTMSGFQLTNWNADLLPLDGMELPQYSGGINVISEVAFAPSEEFEISLGIVFAETIDDFFNRLYGGIKAGGMVLSMETGKITGTLPVSLLYSGTLDTNRTVKGDYLKFNLGLDLFDWDMYGLQSGLTYQRIAIPTKIRIWLPNITDIYLYDLEFIHQGVGLFLESDNLRSLLLDDWSAGDLIEFADEGNFQCYLGWSSNTGVGLSMGTFGSSFQNIAKSIDPAYSDTDMNLFGIMALTAFQLEIYGKWEDIFSGFSFLETMDIGFAIGLDGRWHGYGYFDFSAQSTESFESHSTVPSAIITSWGPYIHGAISF